MPHFQLFDMVRWFHFVALAIGGGAAVTALMISGLEDAQEEYRGLSATLWQKVVSWCFRIAFLVGIALLVVQFRSGSCPFHARYMMIKPVLALAMLAFSEMSPKALARARRGAPLLAILLFLLTSLLTINGKAFGSTRAAAPDQLHVGPEAK